MLDITKDIQSLTTFRRRSREFLKQLKRSKRPIVLTVKGNAAAIVQDAEAYQRLLDVAAQADAEEGIRQGVEDVREGRVRPARNFSTASLITCSLRSTAATVLASLAERRRVHTLRKPLDRIDRFGDIA